MGVRGFIASSLILVFNKQVTFCSVNVISLVPLYFSEILPLIPLKLALSCIDFYWSGS